MIRKTKELGQALIMVLIVLAIGTVLVVPSLRLTATSLMNSPIVERQTKGLYAADAAQEYILWKLLYDDLGQEFTVPGEEGKAVFNFDVCDVPVSATVVMRAESGQGGTTLATDDKIMPIKTVDTGFTPSYWVPDKNEYTYTYTISMDYLSADAEPVDLEAIYDIPPGEFSGIAYQIGTSEISTDGGTTWHSVPDPLWNAAKGYLKWPADYDKDTHTGAFSSDQYDIDHYFYGMRDFEVREVKQLRFQLKGTLSTGIHCNWVVLKMADDTNTLSGPQASVT
ncbi:MAG: hypothetical protein PHQ86_08880, partial [Dehalococcoidales bacterium]|nr:hypothetical protein [Dehalococcoidales bacterium]